MSGTISYTPAEQDYVDARRVHYLRASTSRRAVRELMLTMAAMGFIVFGLLLLVGEKSAACAAILAASFCALTIIPASMLAVTGYVVVGRQARRAFRQQQALWGTCKASWSDEGMEAQSAVGNSSIPWSKHHGWRSENVGYLLYLSDHGFYLLPRSALDEGQLADLDETLAKSGLRPR